MTQVKRTWDTIERGLTPDVCLRFWSYVDRNGDCWTWTGCRIGGYGAFRVPGVASLVTAHRISYGVTRGGIPGEMNVCHHCDNPACCNPAHLFLGTHRDNMLDMLRKGRGRRAEPKTHCGKGHPMTAENTVMKLTRGRRHRVCRTCHNARARNGMRRLRRREVRGSGDAGAVARGARS